MTGCFSGGDHSRGSAARSRPALAGAFRNLVPGAAWAQHITIDGSLGTAARTLAEPNYAITASLGKQVGGNLFQSFGIFGPGTKESATFSGPASANNVIGRVTGGNLSSINDQIASTINGASLYLIRNLRCRAHNRDGSEHSLRDHQRHFLDGCNCHGSLGPEPGRRAAAPEAPLALVPQ